MIEVEITFHVSYPGTSVKTETVKTKVDKDIYAKATGSDSRKELNSWAMQFFPKAKEAKVVSIKKL